MDRKDKDTYKTTGTADELEERLFRSWQDFSEDDEGAYRDDLIKIKERVDDFIDAHERDRRRRIGLWHVWGKIAAVLVPVLVAGVFALMLAHEKSERYDSRLCVATGDRERATVTLPDGTDVCLNAGSRLWYSPDFTTDSVRAVSFAGEAYFDVAKDAEHPFQILLGDLTVRVLGTSFNVRALDGDSAVTVALVEGVVQLMAPGEKLTLDAGSVARYDRGDNVFEIKDHGCHLATGWMRHQKSYDNVSPDSLIYMLERDYEIELSAEAKSHIDDAFTGTLPDDNLNEALTILSEVYGFDMKAAVRVKP